MPFNVPNFITVFFYFVVGLQRGCVFFFGQLRSACVWCRWGDEWGGLDGLNAFILSFYCLHAALGC